MSDAILNERFRNIPIETPEGYTFVDTLINVAVDIENISVDSAFGKELLDRFDLLNKPSEEEFSEWLDTHANGEYGEMINQEKRQQFLGYWNRVIEILVESAIKAVVGSLGLDMIEITANDARHSILSSETPNV